MSWSILWVVLGLGCLVAAGVLVTKVKSAELGEHSSRFIAVFLALSAYYGATSMVDVIPQLTLNPVTFVAAKYGVPIAGGIGLLYCGWMVKKHWKDETDSVVMSSRKLLCIVVCSLLARIFLSL